MSRLLKSIFELYISEYAKIMVVDLTSIFYTKSGLIFLICVLIASAVVFAHSYQNSQRVENPS
ncbi:hypothetical protein B9Q11_02105 [Candidatus Marsarchaeota G2 archaeon ECH_B_SAG-F08]|uniref:Uncharacterized protein n=1 Tax=Candidatus Marsarchaeota G2 archaeon ECH_B_SAG-F08 TaxID=1978165 RepID=A0A2R6BIT2_9ARCH|nr:MAG: hypothetical protein B9Q11_02105 [Candidatus Marsarchaeota G2 archaeon ECH_B_SAG-F08]